LATTKLKAAETLAYILASSKHFRAIWLYAWLGNYAYQKMVLTCYGTYFSVFLCVKPDYFSV